MSKLSILMIGIVILCDCGYGGRGVDKTTYEKLARQIQVRYGVDFQIEFAINVDSSHHEGVQYSDAGITDPNGLLSGCIAFAIARNDLDDTLSGRGLFGLYKNGVIQWDSEPIINCRYITSMDLYGALMSSRDGRIDLLVSHFQDMRSETADMWIFSWDGHEGHVINAVTDDHESVLRGYMYSWTFVDDDGDGILEIHARDPETDSLVIYSWNGEQYGNWHFTIPPGHTPPRDRIAVDILSTVFKSDSVFTYRYTVANRQTSLQKLDDLEFDRRTASLSNATGRSHWNFLFRLKSIVGWENEFLYPFYLSQGESDSSFAFQSTGLPGIVSYYARGNNPPGQSPVYSVPDRDLELQRNSAKGIAVGPIDSPIPFDIKRFLDTLKSAIHRSLEAGWISSWSDEVKYEALVDSTQSYVSQHRTHDARNMLDSAIQESKRDYPAVISGEAFAIIRFNSEFASAQLNKAPPQYMLSVNTVGSGTVTLSPAQAYFDSGSTVELTAAARAGFIFSGWNGDTNCSANPVIVIMSGPRNIVATFVAQGYIINASSGPHGSIFPTGQVSVAAGKSQTFTFSPTMGFHVDSVVVDGVDQGPLSKYTFENVSRGHTLYVTFADKFRLTVIVKGEGSVTRSPDLAAYLPGTSVRLAARVNTEKIQNLQAQSPNKPEPKSWRFSSWELDATGSKNPITIIMNRNMVLRAVFVPVY
ncbi:MAG TPA: hypothetical protein VLY03_04195 [Bacteroidota bacterium]|nr:hypothetical protein [Bacteroidota bacterium]